MLCRKTVLRLFSVFFLCLFLFSCASQTSVNLAASGKIYPLNALNKAASEGTLQDTGKPSYLYYGFADNETLSSFIADKSHPLSLKLSFTSDAEASVTVAFLYADDFDGEGLKHGTLSKRPVAVTRLGAEARAADMLFALPPDNPGSVKGFLVQATGQVKLKAAELCTARLGLIQETNALLTVGFGPDGGSWQGGGSPDSFNFSQAAAFDSVSDGGYIIVHFRNCVSDTGKNGKPGYVTFLAGSTEFSCRRVNDPHQLTTIYSNRLQNKGALVSVVENREMVTGIEYEVIPKGSLAPIITDPGCIIDWPMSKWRNNEYEYFIWDKFPNILFFDTRDYSIQDAMLKRLAFFSEKEGYRGTLAPDSEIADQHGYNAHDYRAETLAEFFDKAQKENFQLNRLEKDLCTILVDNGIIVKTKNGYSAGEGAIISISQESAHYLRSQLLSHETFHGLYFTTEAFRNKVAEVRESTDKKSLDFIYGYFESQPSLGYDRSDEYLMQNEFMAYVLQLGVSSVPSYFADNLAWRGSVMEAMPELSAYIRETKAAGIVEAARKLDDFVFETWSMNAGRPWIVSMGY